MEIGQVQVSDLDAIGRLHAHFWGEVSDSYLVIEDVVVDPRHRRRGVASALLEELERFARDRCCKQMVLLSEACRDDAAGLYESAGFAARWIGFKKKL